MAHTEIDIIARLAQALADEPDSSASPDIPPSEDLPRAISFPDSDSADRCAELIARIKRNHERLTEARAKYDELLTEAMAWLQTGDDSAMDGDPVAYFREQSAAVERLVAADTPDPAVEAAIRPPELQPFEPPNAFDAEGRRQRMGDVLVQAGVITQEELDAALSEQALTPHKHLGEILVEHGYVSSHMIARIIASQIRLPYADLEEEGIDTDAALIVPADLAYAHGCLPIRTTATEVILAMEDPLDLVALHAIEQACGRRVVPVVAAMEDIREARERVYPAA